MDHSLRSFSFLIFYIYYYRTLPLYRFIYFILLLFSCQVVFDSLWLWTQHTESPCPSPSPTVCPFALLSSPKNEWSHIFVYCNYIRLNKLISFEQSVLNVKDLKLWYQYLYYFLPVVLEEPRDHSYSTKASPMNCLTWIIVPILIRNVVISLISLVRHHKFGVGKLLHQSKKYWDAQENVWETKC